MIYAENITDDKKLVGITTSENLAKEMGFKYSFEEHEVEQAYDGSWYVKGYAPDKPEPTKEEVRQAREALYRDQKDPITCQIQSLRDEEQTEEIIAEIAQLVEERKAKVEEIKQRYKYPAEPIEEIEELPVIEETNSSETEEVIEDGLQG